MNQQTWKLEKTKQCKNCPWLIGHDKSKIPNYDPIAHRQLQSTIQEQTATEFIESINDNKMKIMACHELTKQNNYHCIGWINNQLIHNNLRLRFHMFFCENAKDIELIGEQHKTFEDTFS
ncbi:MAG: hypothetical protein Tsb0014_35600 [Pleurocapsa sp.]